MKTLLIILLFILLIGCGKKIESISPVQELIDTTPAVICNYFTYNDGLNNCLEQHNNIVSSSSFTLSQDSFIIDLSTNNTLTLTAYTTHENINGMSYNDIVFLNNNDLCTYYYQSNSSNIHIFDCKLRIVYDQNGYYCFSTDSTFNNCQLLHSNDSHSLSFSFISAQDFKLFTTTEQLESLRKQLEARKIFGFFH